MDWCRKKNVKTYTYFLFVGRPSQEYSRSSTMPLPSLQAALPLARRLLKGKVNNQPSDFIKLTLWNEKTFSHSHTLFNIHLQIFFSRGGEEAGGFGSMGDRRGDKTKVSLGFFLSWRHRIYHIPAADRATRQRRLLGGLVFLLCLCVYNFHHIQERDSHDGVVLV